MPMKGRTLGFVVERGQANRRVRNLTQAFWINREFVVDTSAPHGAAQRGGFRPNQAPSLRDPAVPHKDVCIFLVPGLCLMIFDVVGDLLADRRQIK
jgi:hypothetical protein